MQRSPSYSPYSPTQQDTGIQNVLDFFDQHLEYDPDQAINTNYDPDQAINTNYDPVVPPPPPPLRHEDLMREYRRDNKPSFTSRRYSNSDCYEVFLHNISHDVQIDELRDMLNTIVPIASFRMVRRPDKVFAFAQVRHRKDFERLLDASGFKLDGKRVRIRKAEKHRPQRN